MSKNLKLLKKHCKSFEDEEDKLISLKTTKRNKPQSNITYNDDSEEVYLIPEEIVLELKNLNSGSSTLTDIKGIRQTHPNITNNFYKQNNLADPECSKENNATKRKLSDTGNLRHKKCLGNFSESVCDSLTLYKITKGFRSELGSPNIYNYLIESLLIDIFYFISYSMRLKEESQLKDFADFDEYNSLNDIDYKLVLRYILNYNAKFANIDSTLNEIRDGRESIKDPLLKIIEKRIILAFIKAFNNNMENELHKLNTSKIEFESNFGEMEDVEIYLWNLILYSMLITFQKLYLTTSSSNNDGDSVKNPIHPSTTLQKVNLVTLFQHDNILQKVKKKRCRKC